MADDDARSTVSSTPPSSVLSSASTVPAPVYCKYCKRAGHVARDAKGVASCPSLQMQEAFRACMAAADEAQRQESKLQVSLA